MAGWFPQIWSKRVWAAFQTCFENGRQESMRSGLICFPQTSNSPQNLGGLSVCHVMFNTKPASLGLYSTECIMADWQTPFLGALIWYWPRLEKTVEPPGCAWCHLPQQSVFALRGKGLPQWCPSNTQHVLVPRPPNNPQSSSCVNIGSQYISWS